MSLLLAPDTLLPEADPWYTIKTPTQIVFVALWGAAAVAFLALFAVLMWYVFRFVQLKHGRGRMLDAPPASGPPAGLFAAAPSAGLPAAAPATISLD